MIRWAESRSPSTPSAPSSIAALNSTAPKMSDWMWPATPPPTDEVDEEADEERHCGHARDDRAAPEHPQRLVLRVDPEDRQSVAADVGRDRREQARLARLGVGADRDVVDRHQQLARLDDRLQRVGELRDHLHLQRRLAVVGAKTGGRVRHLGGGGLAHHPGAQALQPALGMGEMLVGVHPAVADHHVGLAAQDGRDQLGDVAALVLVVGVGVDDDVGAELEPGVEPRLEARRQALVVGQLDDVVDAVGPRDLDRRGRSSRRR